MINQASGIAVAIQEAKKMIREKLDSGYGQGINTLEELIERLEKKDSISEQSRYDIALEVYEEFLKESLENFTDWLDWLEEKKNSLSL